MKKSQARVDARVRGDANYVPELPCRKGHALRSVSSGSCIECRRESENLRVSKNRLSYNARKKRERVGKLPELAEKMKVVRATELPEQRAIRLKKAKLAQREWRANNPNHVGSKQAKQRYKKNNPGRVRADTVKRVVSKLHRTPAWLTDDDHWMIRQAYDLAALRTRMFGFAWHVDHVIPLQGKYVSGLHTPVNLQVIPAIANIVKANKFTPA